MEGRADYMQATAAASMHAYREIQALTNQYNALSGGKWKGLMNMMPRDLPVFNPPTLPYLPEDLSLQAPALNSSKPKGNDFVARNACDYQSAAGKVSAIQMLGHSMNAVAIPKGGEVVYEFESPLEGDAVLRTALIPTQPSDRGDLRYAVRIDNQAPVVISLKEPYRSEQWKQNVLRGQALKQTPIHLTKGSHKLYIKALDDHIIVDQWMVDFNKKRQFYVIPIR
jgi:hypothetical protein